MSHAEFLRRSAMALLKDAERTEKLEKILLLPDQSVVIFVRHTSQRDKWLTYAAICVENPNEDERGPYAGRKWFVTHAGRYELGPFTDEKFVEWLVAGRVDDINVVVAILPLGDLDAKKLATPGGYTLNDLDDAQAKEKKA